MNYGGKHDMINDLDATAPEYYNIAWDIDRYADEDTKVAIYWENEQGVARTVTYQELRDLSNKFANAMKQMGLTQGDIVIILLPRIPETYITYLAALKLGLIISPGSEMLMPKDILHRVEQAEAKAVISYHTLTNRIDEIRPQTNDLKHFISVGGTFKGWENFEKMTENCSSKFDYVQTRSDDIAFLNFTSGTTGIPKGVIHHHSFAFAHQAIATQNWLNIRRDDIVWSTSAPGWAKWQHNAFMCTLGSGASGLVYFGKFSPEKHLELLKKYNVSVLCCTPTEYRFIAKTDDLESFHLPYLRSAVSAGEPLSRHVIDTFKTHFNVEIRDGYGQTESSLLIATLTDWGAKPGSMGKPIYSHKVSLMDRNAS
jgi:acetyl-CoA synthetase